MANKVFANNMEVCCKAASGMTTAALPDVCMTPPENPATPPGVPVPYPNTGKASDTTEGSKSVKISQEEVGLKNKSYFKTSYGDEAGCAAKKGVVTSKNKGKVYFQAWSSDVKFEGENAVRHLDLTTNNHASVPGDTPTWPYLDQQFMLQQDSCFKDVQKVAHSCTGDPKQDCPVPKSGYKENACVKAKRCMLQPYTPTEGQKGGCCPEQTPHHLIPKRGFKDFADVYSEGKAPCVCAEGTSHHRGQKTKTPELPDSELTHPDMHAGQDYLERLAQATPTVGGTKDKPFTYKEARSNAVLVHSEVYDEADCNPGCLARQLDNYHKQAGVKDDDLLTSPSPGWPKLETLAEKAASDPRTQAIINNVTATLAAVTTAAAAVAVAASSL